MGQAVAELPDPLDSPQPTDGVSADDLLSKLAGDEIDRLLAESDGGGTEPAQLVAPPAPVATVPTPPAPSVAATAAAVDLDDVLKTADAERAALHEHPTDVVSTQIDLGESTRARRATSLWLKPLVWINAPLEPWPDQLRDILGKIGVMTLVNALAVIAYVLLFRRHGK